MKKENNQFVIKEHNDKVLEKSVRLIQYITLYNLREDQIFYMCPLMKNQLVENDKFNKQIQCLYELSDETILFEQERKKRLKELTEEQEREKERLKRMGLDSVSSILKKTIYDSPLKSSAYVSPQQSAFRKNKTPDPVKAAMNPIDSLKSPFENFEKKTQSEKKIEQVEVDDLFSYHSSLREEKNIHEVIREESQQNSETSDFLKVSDQIGSQNKGGVIKESKSNFGGIIIDDQNSEHKRSDIIPSQINESKKDSSIYDLLRESEVWTQRSEVYSGLSGENNITWMLKLEAMDREERLIEDRLREKWNRPLKILRKVTNLKFEDFAKDVISNPQYNYEKKKFNFGTILN